MKQTNIALGFYQELATAQSVVHHLKLHGFLRFALIHCKKDNALEVKRCFGLGFLSMVPWETINRYKNLVLSDEILVIVQVPQKSVRDVLAILRQVKSGHPVSFLLRGDIVEEGHVEIPPEPLTMEQLRQAGSDLAYTLQQTVVRRSSENELLKRIQQSDKKLQFLRQDIADAEYIEQTIPMSAEWLLDNMYVIEGSIEDVKRNLPKKYYNELPKIINGPLAGFPRIYAIAVELIKSTAGRLDKENVTEFLRSFQKNQSLTIGELWAFPLMLRFRLIEWIHDLAIHVDNRMREGELASFWGNRLLAAARHEPERLPTLMEMLSLEYIKPSPHFAEELLDHLFDDESIIPLVRKWLEGQFSVPLTDVLHQEQIHETAEQIIFSSCVMSLITLSQLAWPAIFEEVSLVDAILREDPHGTYSSMDFATRNSYREAVEDLARHSKNEETKLAKQVVSMACTGSNETEQHIGYYLIDEGRCQLEKQVGYHAPLIKRIRHWIRSHSHAVYLGGVLLITAAIAIGLKEQFLLLILSLPLALDVAIQVIDLLLTMVLQPSELPRMSFKKGIPEQNKTLVVIPMMLMTPESLKEEIHQLEIRYLANTDPHLLFALFSDFADASTEHVENDSSLLAIAVEGFKGLENKYGQGKFFLFNRPRRWSASENAWIGWERKRGKLEYLNRYLMGESLPENILHFGVAEALKGIRYVITLDADTQLPKDQAKALVEVLSHPLNRPHLTADNKAIARGYTIIQPRVATDFVRSRVSWFSRLFSEPAALDPYTQAISNVYQDLVGEGTYHGKGIYDVQTFHCLLSQRFPDEHLLSHDLLEGAYVRVGFSSQICLFDSHPEDYLSWIKRKHRWMRGDWQIIDWLWPKVPNGKEKESNPLSWCNRWKVFDNLRRAILPLCLLIFLILGWTISSSPELWTSMAAFVLFMPCLSFGVIKLANCSFLEFKTFLTEFYVVLLRTIFGIALLPFEAYQALDAFIRVAYRRFISRRHLLQWTPSEHVKASVIRVYTKFLLQLGVFSLLSLLLLFVVKPNAIAMAISFIFLWVMAPLIVFLLNRSLEKRTDAQISEEDKKHLRMVARKTWRYFHDFVGPETHWLPPDNYQTALRVELAQRTSPTNIGFWLLSLLGAYDLRYITCDVMIDKALATMQELKKLERYEGHFLNWYNTQTSEPLFPRYISTVDSGNLLASLWTLKQGIYEAILNPLFPDNAFSGINDIYEILQEAPPGPFIQHIKDNIKNKPSNYWIKQIEEDVISWESILSRYLSWVDILNTLSAEDLNLIDPKAISWKEQVLSLKTSLQTLATGSVLEALKPLIELSQKQGLSPEIKGWGKKLNETLATSQWLAGEKIGQAEEIIEAIDRFSQEMNLQYLYNTDRKLFAIGYNVDDRRLDSSFYDLLASEARVASLVAIANENVPLEHWWALGRYYTIVNGRRVLVSWGGTMFEYLMPLVFNRQYADSLLGEACQAVVACQIDYGNKRGIPWGISESAFSGIDSHKIYQYKSFGIPGVGLKRGLEEDLIVSPYSSALALAVDAPAAIKNLKKMSGTHENLMGPYGYYESIDYTRQRSPEGERGVIVYTYMAHHQGMIFTSINNLLNDDSLVKRFHEDPRICGINSLLYERIPSSPPLKVKGVKKEHTLTRLKPFSKSPIMGVVETPESVVPKVNLLSNENYSLMITNTGGGYSCWQTIDITRWRADTTRDPWGSFYYLKDMKSGDVWSAAYQPTQNSGKEYSVNFKGDKAEFKRKDHKIETVTEIVVSPEDNAEIWLITLTNHSAETRYIEITSYIELALAPHSSDRAHPCFNKLFIETEPLPELSSLLAFRRLRSPDDKPIWSAHILTSSHIFEEAVQYETDRNKFIGRGKSLKKPLALEGDLSNTAGTVLDPIFSLRRRVAIEPGRRVQFSFITAIADSRPAILVLIEKYQDLAASHRAVEVAWTYAQLELRHLRIHQEEVQLFQKLASRVLYPHAQLRIVEERLRNNQLGQSGLWAQGISGDLPIVVVTVGDIYDTDLVKQVLIAHAFWHLRGLKVDLVVLNEEAAGYLNPLQEQLQNMIKAYSYRSQIDVPGGVFLRNSEKINPEELNVILCSARAILVAARGSLRQQLVSPRQRSSYPPKLLVHEKMQETPSQPLPFMELPYFNGLGGYTNDGKSYVIYLSPTVTTPAPWVNVIANPQFGILVSESGPGCTWYGNSQSNRLTPWSNDPLLDPISDVIYIRDESSGIFWTPTPSPIRELDAYRVTHSQGYSRFEHNSHGINQELLIFVPMNETGGLPLCIQRLRLTNYSAKRRHLSLTTYSEWVLGTEKEETQMHVITEWDSESQAIFAYNRFNPDFGSHVAFSTSIVPAASYTGDRTEFLGRNGSSSNPEALKRKSLSGRTGAALDPCAALQVLIEIDPNATVEVIFIMGYAADSSAARQLIVDCRSPGKIEQLFSETQAWWDKTLGTIQVNIPDLATNYLINRWLPYQNLSCRFWGRAAFYQSSGAYGFRDQLQDSMALVYSLPHITREHILRSASRQFVEGDVQHWWHPQSGGGIRTRFSDDLLWLPFATAHYVRVTGDLSILEESIPFLEGEQLAEDQHEVYQIPTVTKERVSLLEHCRRAIQKGNTAGPHGLPLIGVGDWNDGMNRVGIKGKGESVWLAWFLIQVMNDFAELLTSSTGKEEQGEGYRIEARRLAEIVEKTAWDGAWYRRAYFDDGTPIGSKDNQEAFIDSLAQSWAVICGHGDPERRSIALSSAEEYLVKRADNMVLLLTPPFDKTPLDPGYIKGYPPGVRENGGQYTHGSLWLAMAFARQGDGNKAVELLKMMSPTLHTNNPEANALYRVEPYALAADIYDLKMQVGRGGWTWYTGSAAWMYRIWLEEVLGFKLRGQTLQFNCAIPPVWNGFTLKYMHGSTQYEINVANPHHLSTGNPVIQLDGILLSSSVIPLSQDGGLHKIEITI
jgi:cyclic beta-1,2-glucan synthetase